MTALDPDHTITQYGHTAWTREDGRLPGAVLALTQTIDGRLWVGTEFGLFQFDGIRFSPLRPPGFEKLPDQTITALASGPGGALWIGGRDLLLRWDGASAHRYALIDNGRGAAVSAIHVDRRGSVWIGTVGWGSGGLARVESKRLRYYDSSEGFTGSGVLSLLEDHAGGMWIRCTNGVYRWDGAGFHRHHRESASAEASSIAVTADGMIVAAEDAKDLKGPTGDGFTPRAGGGARGHFETRTLLRDRDGGLWIGTEGQGLVHSHKDRFERLTSRDGLSGNTVIALLEDRERDIWVGTEGGLDRFRDLPVSKLTSREGLPEEMATSVFASLSGGVWVGTEKGLDLVRGDQITGYGSGSGLPSGKIGSLFEDQSGNVWVGCALGLTVGRNGRFHPAAFPGSGIIRTFAAAAEDSDGVLWFSDLQHGLISLEGEHVRSIVPWSIFRNREATALGADPKGKDLLLGFLQGGVARYRPGLPPTWYDVAEGLAPGKVTDFAIDPKGVIWIATEGGLSRLQDGRIRTLSTKNGLACDRIHALIEDASGGLWMDTPCALQHITRQNLDAWSANPMSTVRERVYGPGDGMQLKSIRTGYTRGGARSLDGRIWIPVFDGVAVIDPKNLHENNLPPPVAIEAIRVNDRTQTLEPGLLMGPNVKDLQIDYTAFSLADADRDRFRYQLDGYDKVWHDALSRRQAFYSNLPPGHYRFRVIAANNAGVWNTGGAAIDFAVVPAFHQTIWFALLCAAAATGVFVLAYRLHLRRIRATIYVRVQERMRERNRIGSELHDTLLQNIAGFALQLEGLSKIVKEPQSLRDDLRGLRRQAEQWLRDAREFVWDLRLDNDEDQNLATALSEAGKRLTQRSEIRFETEVTGIEPPVPERVRIHLLRIVQEAVNNAVRHSGATEIQLGVCYLAEGMVRICIADDGCGFTPARDPVRPGHWGLTTMRERAQKLGGDFTLVTEPGNGARIEITVPVVASGNVLTDEN